MNLVKGLIIGQMDNTQVLNNKSHFVLTLHINALNIRFLNHGHSAVGVLCFTGIGMSYYRDIPPISHLSWGGNEFRISNVQIINLNCFDTTNVNEIFGKRDMFWPILQSREIFQMADIGYSRSWVSDGQERLEKYFNKNDLRAQNIHI